MAAGQQESYDGIRSRGPRRAVPTNGWRSVDTGNGEQRCAVGRASCGDCRGVFPAHADRGDPWGGQASAGVPGESDWHPDADRMAGRLDSGLWATPPSPRAIVAAVSRADVSVASLDAGALGCSVGPGWAG